MTKLFVAIALKAVPQFGVATTSMHLDSSSFYVDGEYEGRATEADEPAAIAITYGYSRDHRADLKQFVVDLMCSGDGDIPQFALEQVSLERLPQVRVPDYELLSDRVSTRSMIEGGCILYSVPSRLIGHRIEIHLYHDRLVAYFRTASGVRIASSPGEGNRETTRTLHQLQARYRGTAP